LIASELIATDPECLKMARVLCPSNYLELFNETWLQVRESELDGVVVRDYRNYFFKALRNNGFKKQKEIVIVEHFESNIPCRQFLWDFLKTENLNDDLEFYKNILTLAVVCKNKRDAAKYAEMTKTQFYVHLNKAKQLLKDEYFRTTTDNNFDFDSLV